MKRFIFFAAAALGGSFCLVTPAHAMPVSPDGPIAPHRSTLVLTSDPPPRVITKVVHRAQPPKLAKVTVIAGDSLTAIGSRTHRTWEQLAGYNHVANPNLIYVGDVLTVPPASYVPPQIVLPTSAPPSPPPAPTHYSAPVRTYTPSAPVAQYSGGTGGGAFTGVWACIAQHESGGNPSTNTGNGFYGGLQFTEGTWLANGGTGNPANASAAEQQRVANNVVAASGGSYGAWPNTSAMCGV